VNLLNNSTFRIFTEALDKIDVPNNLNDKEIFIQLNDLNNFIQESDLI
jgi:hypothetical protein